MITTQGRVIVMAAANRANAYIVSDRLGTLYEACRNGRGALYPKAISCNLQEESSALQFIDQLQLEPHEWSLLLHSLQIDAERPLLDGSNCKPSIARLISHSRLQFRRLPVLDYQRGVPGVRGVKYCFVPGPSPLPPRIDATHERIDSMEQAQALLRKLDFSQTDCRRLFKGAGHASTDLNSWDAASQQLLVKLLAQKEVLAYAVRSLGAERESRMSTGGTPPARQGAPAAARQSVNAPDPPATSSKATAAPPSAAAKAPAKLASPATAKDFAIPKSPADAPQRIDLSSMQKEFDKLWAGSLPGGISQEQGGTLVSDATGALKLVNPGSGTAGTFSPNLSVDPKQTVLGVFHTHPYDATEGSYTGVSLSGGDAAYTVITKQSAIIAQSGTEQFMYLRTAATPATVDAVALNEAQNNRIGELVMGGRSFPEASKIAAQETAKAQGLAYYEGNGGVLNRVYP